MKTQKEIEANLNRGWAICRKNYGKGWDDALRWVLDE